MIQPGTGAARNTSQVARDHFGGDLIFHFVVVVYVLRYFLNNKGGRFLVDLNFKIEIIIILRIECHQMTDSRKGRLAPS